MIKHQPLSTSANLMFYWLRSQLHRNPHQLFAWEDLQVWLQEFEQQPLKRSQLIATMEELRREKLIVIENQRLRIPYHPANHSLKLPVQSLPSLESPQHPWLWGLFVAASILGLSLSAVALNAQIQEVRSPEQIEYHPSQGFDYWL